jgi:NAD(P)-dependent dehydrogenase (short-subunit alcohol dehydrogenase family)
MKKRVMVVCGYGPGISSAVARKFGNEGFELALIARSGDKLERAVAEFAQQGIVAHAFIGDLSDPKATRALLEQIGTTVGPVTVYFYNAIALIGANVLEASVEELQSCFSVGITSFLAGLQPCIKQMRGQDGAAVLITGGGFAMDTDSANDYAVELNVIGLATVKAAQHKLARTLSKQLQPEGIFVGEVMVMDNVAGTPFDDGTATLTADQIAEAFWQQYTGRGPVTVKVTSELSA